jgi:hypothetical protein
MTGPADIPTDTPAAPAKSGVASFLSARQAVPTGETVTLTPAQEKARKRRSHWIALALFTFVILVFVITMTKLGANVLVRDL